MTIRHAEKHGELFPKIYTVGQEKLTAFKVTGNITLKIPAVSRVSVRELC